nr:unnamed protein product [Callosobruchus chinensis]
MRYNSFSFHVLGGNTRKQICTDAFCGLHGVSKERVKRIRQLLQAGSTPTDKRGKQRSSNAMEASEIILVTEHISTFPTKQTHYSTREYNYLDADLNVKIMHSLFLQNHPQSKITYEYYNKIFRQNFNLSFGRPQVDVCNECETISLKLRNKALNDAAKRVAMAELMVHKRRAKKFYNTLKLSKEACHSQENVFAISFDFMQNLQLPRSPVQDLFHLTKLSVRVFGVHNMKTGEAVFFLYHEGQAKKSPNERKLKTRDRVYTTMEYVEMIVNSSSKHKFTVHQADSTQIQDFRNWWHRYFKKEAISVEMSARSVPRDAKLHYFLFTSENGGGVIAAKDYIGGLMTHTFSLLLPGVVTVDFPNDSAIPKGRIHKVSGGRFWSGRHLYRINWNDLQRSGKINVKVDHVKAENQKAFQIFLYLFSIKNEIILKKRGYGINFASTSFTHNPRPMPMLYLVLIMLRHS